MFYPQMTQISGPFLAQHRQIAVWCTPSRLDREPRERERLDREPRERERLDREPAQGRGRVRGGSQPFAPFVVQMAPASGPFSSPHR